MECLLFTFNDEMRADRGALVSSGVWLLQGSAAGDGRHAPDLLFLAVDIHRNISTLFGHENVSPVK